MREPILAKNIIDLLAISRLKKDVEARRGIKADPETVDGVTFQRMLTKRDVNAIRLSPDGQHLVMTTDTCVQIWDVCPLKCQQTLAIKYPSNVCWINNQEFVVVDDDDAALKKININDYSNTIMNADGNIAHLAFSFASTPELLVVRRDETGDVASVLTATERIVFHQSAEPIKAVAWSQDSKKCAVATDSEVFIYSRETQELLQSFHEQEMNIEQMFFPVNECRLVLSGWTLQEGGKVPVIMNGHVVDVLDFGPSDALNLIAITKRVKLNNPTQEVDCEIFNPHTLRDIVPFDHCNAFLQTVGNQLRLYARRGRLVWCMEEHKCEIYAVSASADGKIIATIDKSGLLVIWNFS